MDDDLATLVELINRMDSRDRELLTDVREALDQIEAAEPGWNATPKGINAKYFGRLAWRIEHRDREGRCHWTGCNQSAVRSHVLAAGTALSVIAENKEVTTVRLRSRHPGVSTISIRSEDVTFPGYCDDHERVFTSFEDGSGFTTNDEIRLQAMRSTAREHWAAIEDMRFMQEYMNAQLTALDHSGFNDEEKINYSVRLTGPLLELIDRIEWKASALGQLLAQLAEPSDASMSSGTVVSRRLPVEGVIALSGSTRLHGVSWSAGSRVGTVLDEVLVMSIVPEREEVLFILAGSNEALIEAYAERFFTEDEAHLLASAWMTATEFWFVTPSWWDELPEQVRQAVVASVESA